MSSPLAPACRILAVTGLLVAVSANAQPLVVVTGPGTPSEVTTAAADLTRIWTVATGADAEVEHRAPAIRSNEVSLFLTSDPVRDPSAPIPDHSDEDAFRVVITTAGNIHLHGATPHATVFSIYWFASHELGARWFMPGPLGEVIPRRAWSPHRRDDLVVPAFLSRWIPAPGNDGALWERRNGLRERWTMGHALAGLIPAERFNQHPNWFPILDGKRYRPPGPGDYNWQPNFNEPTVVSEVARQANAYFRSHADTSAFSICINDTTRFDQSATTVAARGPLRWFRGRPDYSDVVFRFSNQVAAECGEAFPDRLLSAFAYYWCENTPSFPVRPNVLPWLTADRGQWYDPAFAREDQALIRRWVRSGARVVGCYDYFDGRPYMVPIFAPHLIGRSIAFEFDAGVRAYFGETNPSWAFDSPRLWLAAQLLWEPHRSVDEALHEFFEGCYGPAAAPAMRQFFALCEQAWMDQPGHARWIRYYQDQDQANLYPADLRRRLRVQLTAAAEVTQRDSACAERVAGVAAAFAASDAFCALQESRTAVSNSGPSPSNRADPGVVAEYLQRRADFISKYLKAVSISAVGAPDLAPFLIDDPAPRVGSALLRADPSAASLLSLSSDRSGISADAPGLKTMLTGSGLNWSPAPVRDQPWGELQTPASLNDLSFVWNDGAWLGRGEPALGRAIWISSTGSGNAVGYRHATFDHLWQWVPASPGAIYRVQTDFRGRVDLADQEYLMASFRDGSGQYVAAAQDRVPPGNWRKVRHLELYLQAPPTASLLGVAIYACHQTEADWAEFSHFRCDLARPPFNR